MWSRVHRENTEGTRGAVKEEERERGKPGSQKAGSDIRIERAAKISTKTNLGEETKGTTNGEIMCVVGLKSDRIHPRTPIRSHHNIVSQTSYLLSLLTTINDASKHVLFAKFDSSEPSQFFAQIKSVGQEMRLCCF